MVDMKNKSHFFFVCIFVCVLIIIYSYFIDEGDVRRQYLTTFEKRSFSNKSVKKILIWNPFLTEEVREEFRTCLGMCPVRCDISENKSDVSTSDAILFHAYDLWPSNMNLFRTTKPVVEFPRSRQLEQVWAIFNQEPPCNIFWDSSLLNGIFNWSVWYRRDATIWWPYGMKYVVNEPGSPREFGHNYFRKKTKAIAGMISNCVDQAQRYKLVYELQRYLDIDLYGECYNNTCGRSKNPTERKCDAMLREYKFYLAFENSNCKDYVTEKYWESLRRGQIPIVNWKDINTDIVIPNSYINVYDFKDIRSLSEHILKVQSNERLYNSHFNWTAEYGYRKTCVVCSICQALNNQSIRLQVYDDLDGWIREDHCPKFSITSQLLKYIYWWLYWNLGIDIKQT